MPNIPVPQVPQISIDPNKMLATYPWEVNEIKVPNAMNAGKQGADSILGTIQSVPPKLIGTPADMVQTAMQVLRQVVGHEVE